MEPNIQHMHIKRVKTFLPAVLMMVALVGCSTQKNSSAPFLGIPESQASETGPVGLMNGQPCRINKVTAVSETTYEHYQSAKKDGRIFTEENRGGYVYFAIKEQRDVRFDNASAWVEVLERFKARKR